MLPRLLRPLAHRTPPPPELTTRPLIEHAVGQARSRPVGTGRPQHALRHLDRPYNGYLPSELGQGAVPDASPRLRRLENLAAAEVAHDAVGNRVARVGVEKDVAWLLVCPGDQLGFVGLVAAVVQQPDLAAGGVVGGVHGQAGGVEAGAAAVTPDAGGAGVNTAASHIRQPDLLLRRGDERSGEPGGGFPVADRWGIARRRSA